MSACVIWGGYITANGYGRRGRQYAHRLAWEEVHGPIPQGMVIDHLCRNRACVNVEHLRCVTQRENLMAAGSLSAAKINAEKDECVHGHSLADAYRRKNGRRTCRTCHLARVRERDRIRRSK